MVNVGDLILLAAPSCCGKSRFLDELYAGRLEHLWEDMKLEGAVNSYKTLIPRQIDEAGSDYLPKLILHYALPTLAASTGSLGSLSDDARLSVVPRSQNVTIITLVAQPQVMRSRLLARTRSHRTTIFRQIPSSRKVRKYFRERNRLAVLESVYAGSANLESIYDIWFNYCDSLTNVIDSWIVTADDDYHVFTKQHWPDIKKSYFAET